MMFDLALVQHPKTSLVREHLLNDQNMRIHNVEPFLARHTNDGMFGFQLFQLFPHMITHIKGVVL